jgi:hypothetical protein
MPPQTTITHLDSGISLSALDFTDARAGSAFIRTSVQTAAFRLNIDAKLAASTKISSLHLSPGRLEDECSVRPLLPCEPAVTLPGHGRAVAGQQTCFWEKNTKDSFEAKQTEKSDEQDLKKIFFRKDFWSLDSSCWLECQDSNVVPCFLGLRTNDQFRYIYSINVSYSCS